LIGHVPFPQVLAAGVSKSYVRDAMEGPGRNLDEETRVEGEAGTYTAKLSQAWEIWGPNGGYLAAIALRAAVAEAAIPVVASVYCQFLRVARFDSVTARVEVLQRGRRSEAIRVRLVQDDKPVLEGLVRTALPGPGIEEEPPARMGVPGPEGLPTFDELYPKTGRQFAFWDNIEARILQPERFASPRPAIQRDWLEWYRFRPRATFDDPVVDCLRALVLIDTLGWPATWLKHPDTLFRAPSLDVAVFFHAPAGHSEWLLAEAASPIAKNGLVGTNGRVFDRGGRLVASGGAQLLCVPVPGLA
jgi:acyl-CoA thioesterase